MKKSIEIEHKFNEKSIMIICRCSYRNNFKMYLFIQFYFLKLIKSRLTLLSHYIRHCDSFLEIHENNTRYCFHDTKCNSSNMTI